MSCYLAIDFETATYSRDSACAVGLVLVRDRRIIEEKTLLIRPPEARFDFTHIHGLTWSDVRHAPCFGDHWPTINSFIERADFLIAHNAPFDSSVLRKCCTSYGLPNPSKRFVCTVALSRSQWGIYPTKLPNVCSVLGIPLNHHDAASDAKACASIAIRAEHEGWRP